MEYCRLGVVEFKWGFQRLSANTVLMMDSNIDETGALACFAVEPLEYVVECDIGFHCSAPWFSDGKSPHGSFPMER